MNRKELLDALAPVPGWLADEEAVALYKAAKSCGGRGAVVELGSWRGRSTICLALGSRDGAGAPVISVDRHLNATYRDFRRNIAVAGVGDFIRPVRGLTREIAFSFDEAIELLFIDASHQYEDVWLDFCLWAPKVVEGGTVAMHDSTWAGSKYVSEEMIYRSRRFTSVRFVPSSLTIATKRSRETSRERWRSRRVMSVKRLVELGLRLRKLLPRRLVRLIRDSIAAAGS